MIRIMVDGQIREWPRSKELLEKYKKLTGKDIKILSPVASTHQGTTVVGVRRLCMFRDPDVGRRMRKYRSH